MLHKQQANLLSPKLRITKKKNHKTTQRNTYRHTQSQLNITSFTLITRNHVLHGRSRICRVSVCRSVKRKNYNNNKSKSNSKIENTLILKEELQLNGYKKWHAISFKSFFYNTKSFSSCCCFCYFRTEQFSFHFPFTLMCFLVPFTVCNDKINNNFVHKCGWEFIWWLSFWIYADIAKSHDKTYVNTQA